MPAKPFIRDPSGLLARIPELEDIAEEDRRVLNAIESGEPHAVFAALRWGRLLRRIRRHAATAKELLENRRLFLTRPRGRLWLSTYNGLGATFYGEHEPDFVDGSYIATHFLTLFFLPVFPLGQYLVKNAAAQNGGQGYFVLGKVPFRIVLRLWSRLITLAIFIGFVATLLSLLRSVQHNSFYVINELGVPIQAEIAGRVMNVAPSTQQEADLPTGTHAIAIYGPAHRLIEKGEVRIRPGHKIIAWNVLGGAALLHRTIEYRPTSAMSKNPAPPVIHCGDRTVAYRRVDYVFKEPPKSLRISGSGESRSYLAIAEPGVSACQRYLQQQSRLADAVALSAGHARAQGHALPAFEEEMDTLMRLEADEALLELAREGRAAHPHSVAHHRIYQNALDETGKKDQARAEYAQPLDPPLSEADAAYLAARLTPPGAERLAHAAALPASFPEHGDSLAWSASIYCDAGDYARAVPLYERLRRLHPTLYARDLSLVVMALVGTGQAKAARAAIRDQFDHGAGEGTGNHRAQLPLAVMDAIVAAKTNAAEDEALIRRLAGDNTAELRAVARMLAGQPPPPTAGKVPSGAYTVWQAQEQVLKSPDGALGIDLAALRQLPGHVSLLVLAEAVAAQHPRAAELRAALAHAYPRRFLDKALRYVRDGGELDIVEPTIRATLLFVRSRHGGLPLTETQALRAEAARLAVLSGTLPRAIASWSKLDEKTEQQP